MSNEYKEWLQDQTFETLATDNYNIKLLLLAEQAKNKKLVEALEKLANKCTARDFDYCNNKCINGKAKNNDCYHLEAQLALNEVNK